MNDLKIKELMSKPDISIFEISEIENESLKSFAIKSQKVTGDDIDGNICTSVLSRDGKVLSSMSLKKNGSVLTINLSNEKKIPFSGDLTRSGITNVLYFIAGSPEDFEINHFISNDIKMVDIKNVDLDFQNKAIGSSEALVITPDSIFDRNCSKCGGGGGKNCYCGSWSQNCYCD